MRRTQVIKIIKILVSLTLLAVALYLLDWDRLISSFQRLDPGIFVLAVVISFTHLVISALRWHQIVYKFAPLPLLEHLKLYFYATFLNSFTPANMGGDAYRLLALKSRASGSVPILIALVRERLLGLLSYFWGFLFCLVCLWIVNPATLYRGGKLFSYLGGAVSAGTVGVLVAPYIFAYISDLKPIRSRERLVTVIASLCDAAQFNSLVDFAKLMGLSLLSLFIWVLTAWVVSMDLGIDISWLQLGATVVLVELVRLVPVSMQGIGAREGMYAYVFTLFDKSPEAGFMLGTVSYLALSFSLLLSGLVGWSLMYFLPSEHEAHKQFEKAR